MNDNPGITILVFIGVPLMIAVWTIVTGAMRALRRAERRRLIEMHMRQEYQDAQDSQAIARKLLREYER